MSCNFTTATLLWQKSKIDLKSKQTFTDALYRSGDTQKGLSVLLQVKPIVFWDAQLFFWGGIARLIFSFNLAKSDNIYTIILTYYYWIVVNKYHICKWSVFKTCVALQEWLLKDCLKKKYILERKTSRTDFQSCYVVTTFYFEDRDRNVERKVWY